MKKRALSLFAALGFLSTSFVFASQTNLDLKGYYSSQHPSTVVKATTTMFPPTDITVANSSSDGIYVVVPNTPIHDFVYAGNNDHIRHSSYYGDTHLILEDPYHHVFFDNYVCRLAVVNVLGQPGAYHLNVDSEYCH